MKTAHDYCRVEFNFYSSFLGRRRDVLVAIAIGCRFSFFLVSWGGVRLGPLCTSATIWHIVPALDDRWWIWSSRWNKNWQGKPKYSEKTCLSTTLSTTNPTWYDLGSNMGRRGGNPVTNRLSYDTAFVCRLHSRRIGFRFPGQGRHFHHPLVGKTASVRESIPPSRHTSSWRDA
jgi:hypothetical protein